MQLTTEQSKIVDSLPLPDGKKEFLSKVALAVMQADPEMHGINPRVMLAQAILETGWGSSSLAWRYNNLFGMKYWGEGKATPPIRTSEYAGRGDPYTINARFRAFDSLLESVQAYIADISSDPWYKDATRYPHDDSKYLNGLLNGKMAYATTPTYKSMILNIIEKFHLRQLTRLPT
ncbi:MAG TPA: glucosaminidase domain-containing protein [Candidatus Saccharimonadales bacterium]